MTGKNMIRGLAPAGLLLLAACAGPEVSTPGLSYPPTEKVEAVFQRTQVPEQCRVYAQLFTTLPAGYSGRQFVEVLSAEAKSRGADMMLIGQSRQCPDEAEMAFTYFGPDREYKIKEWPGWNYGFEEWQKQGDWANIGFNEWGNDSVRFDFPVVMQVVFLRCWP
jgi:hypothetical protein